MYRCSLFYNEKDFYASLNRSVKQDL